MTTRGKLSSVQITQLLQPIDNYRVVTGPHVKPHLSQQDVVAHLSRIFGFGNFDVEVISSDCIYEEPMTNSNGKPAWRVAYRALVRLSIRDEHGNLVAHYDGGSTGESDGQPSRADSHDLAFKSSLSTATKRAAIHLGDQFGLSLYNKGQREALVRGSLIGTGWTPGGDVQQGVPQQEEDGGAAADRFDGVDEPAPEEPSALPKATKRATNGKQGTRRRVKPEPVEAAAPTAAAPAAPAPEAPALDPEVEERAQRELMAAQQERQVSERERIIATGEAVDRADEAAVAAWNAEHGKATGHFITSDAERARQAARTVEDPPTPLDQGDADTLAYLDEQTGDVYDTQADLDAAIKARVQAKQEARSAEAPAATGQPSEYELAVSEEPENFTRHAAAAATDPELRTVWDAATAAGAMTPELRMLIVERKEQLGRA